MKLQQIIVNKDHIETVLFLNNQFDAQKSNLVLAFGERIFLESISPYKKLDFLYPNAKLLCVQQQVKFQIPI